MFVTIQTVDMWGKSSKNKTLFADENCVMVG